jgi:antitoxin component HigA of HigAB toxin-antitoxin module
MEDRVQLLKDWIEREGRKQSWVAQQIGCTPQWLNYILKGKRPLSDRLARTLREKLGIPFPNGTRTPRNRTAKQTKVKGKKSR